MPRVARVYDRVHGGKKCFPFLLHEPQRSLCVPTIAHATRLIKLARTHKEPSRKGVRCVRTRREEQQNLLQARFFPKNAGNITKASSTCHCNVLSSAREKNDVAKTVYILH